MIRYLADPLILPLNTSSYSEALKGYILDLKKGYGELLQRNGVSLGKFNGWLSKELISVLK